MYRERLEKDGVHHLMGPEPGLAGSPANAADVDATADCSSSAPCASAEVTAITTSEGTPGTEDPELQNKEEVDRGAKKSDDATTAPTSAITSSSLVPRGAYRRLLCVPADVSWEAATPWDGADGDAGGNTATESSPPCTRAERRGCLAPVADSSSGSGVGGGNGERGKVGGGGSGDKHPEVPGGAGEAEGKGTGGLAATAALRPVLDDVRLTFTLPPGSFATMFLREVMKANDDVAWGVKAPRGNEEGEE